MAIPSSGPLAMTAIQTEFGGSNPISLSEYYAGGGLVGAGTTGTYGAVPSSGTISIRSFYGTSAGPPPGQQAFTSAGTYTWVAPALVTSVSVVVVGGGGGGSGQGSTVTSGTSSQFLTPGNCLTAGGGFGTRCCGGPTCGGSSYGSLRNGGGLGGKGHAGGGGGAGGYSGNGGANPGGSQPGVDGAGGGGGSGTFAYFNSIASAGGGVGLLGQGANGAGAVRVNSQVSTGGGGGSGGACGGYAYPCGSAGFGGDGGNYGGGGGKGNGSAGGGGGLAYGNNISVTPGGSYTVVVGSRGLGAYFAPGYYNGGNGAGGAVRIIWPGNTRSFPSTNTGNL
jgi:hypothetical protein